MWTTSFYRSFFKNILLYTSIWLSKMLSVHTYVMPRTVYFGWICRLAVERFNFVEFMEIWKMLVLIRRRIKITISSFLQMETFESKNAMVDFVILVNFDWFIKELQKPIVEWIVQFFAIGVKMSVMNQFDKFLNQMIASNYKYRFNSGWKHPKLQWAPLNWAALRARAHFVWARAALKFSLVSGERERTLKSLSASAN